MFVLTEVDAGGKCPRCSDDWRDPTKSNHTDGIVRDGEASQQVCVQVRLGYNRVKKNWSKMHFLIFKVSRGSGGIWERTSSGAKQ